MREWVAGRFASIEFGEFTTPADLTRFADFLSRRYGKDSVLQFEINENKTTTIWVSHKREEASLSYGDDLADLVESCNKGGTL